MLENSLISQRYRLEKTLGEGGMGRVCLAYDTLRKETVAVKLIKSNLLESSNGLESFRNEYDILSRLRHPGLVRVFDFGQDSLNGDYFIVEEYLEGKTLRDLLEERNFFNPELVVDIIVSLLRTLEFIHSRKIIYRDLKPDNVIFNLQDKTVKLLDFGLSDLKIAGGKTIKGTVRYLAPEVLNGQIAEQADIFALGVMFYEMLTESFLYSDSRVSSVVSLLSSRENFKRVKDLSLDKITDLSIKELISSMTEFDVTKRIENCSQAIAIINQKLGKKYSVETAETTQAYLQFPSFVNLGHLARVEEFVLSKDQNCLVVTGNEGCGKSRLLEEFVKTCRMNRQQVIVAKASGIGAFSTVKELLDELLFLTSPELIEQYGSQLKKICHDHPRLEGTIIASTLDTESERDQLIALLSSFFIEANASSNFIFGIDQAELLDDFTLEVFWEILLKSEELNQNLHLLLFIKNTIPEHSFTTRIKNLKSAVVVKMTNFSNIELNLYFDAVFNSKRIHSSLSSQSEQFISKTGGNVLFLRELLGYLVVNNYLAKKDERGWVLKRPLDKIDLPDSIFGLAYDKLFFQLNADAFFLLKNIYLLSAPATIQQLKFIFPQYENLERLIFDLADQELITLQLRENNNLINAASETYRKILLDRLDEQTAIEYHLHIGYKLLDYYKINHLPEDNHQLAYHFYNCRSLVADKSIVLAYLGKAAFEDEKKFANKKAISTYQQILDILKSEGSDSRWQELKIDTLIRLANVFRTIGKTAQSVAILKDEIAATADEYPGKIELKIALADIYYFNGDYQQSLDLATDSLYHAREFNADLQIIKLLSSIGNCNAETGNYQQAQLYLQKAVKLSQKLGNYELEAKAYGSLGVVYYDLAEYNKAIKCHKLKLKLLEKIENVAELSSTYNNIGVVYHDKKDLKKAHNFYQNSYDEAKKTGDLRAMSIALGNIGLVYDEQSNFDKAIELYQKSMQLAESCGHKKGVSITAGNIAMICYDLGDYDKSVRFSGKYLKTSELINNRHGIAIASENLALANLALGNLDLAYEQITRAVNLGEELSIKYYTGGFYLTKAKIELARDNKLTAFADLTKAYSYALEIESHEISFESGLLIKKMQFDNHEISRVEYEMFLNQQLLENEDESLISELYYQKYYISRNESNKTKCLNLLLMLFNKSHKIIFKNRIDELNQF